MTILQNDTEFGIPPHLPEGAHRTRKGIVIGRSYVTPPRWDSRPDAERLQRALLRKPRASQWRDIATAVALGLALAATLFFTLSR